MYKEVCVDFYFVTSVLWCESQDPKEKKHNLFFNPFFNHYATELNWTKPARHLLPGECECVSHSVVSNSVRPHGL